MFMSRYINHNLITFMKKILITTLTILFAAITFLSTGCATILGHSNYSVSVNSNPASTVTITNRAGIEVYKGSTPATISLKSSAGYFSRALYQVKFQAAGYQEKIITVESHLNGWYIGNLLLGGA